MLSEHNKDHWLVGRIALLAAVGLSIFQLWQPLAGFFPAEFLPFESGLRPATCHLLQANPLMLDFVSGIPGLSSEYSG